MLLQSHSHACYPSSNFPILQIINIDQVFEVRTHSYIHRSITDGHTCKNHQHHRYGFVCAVQLQYLFVSKTIHTEQILNTLVVSHLFIHLLSFTQSRSSHYFINESFNKLKDCFTIYFTMELWSEQLKYTFLYDSTVDLYKRPMGL